MDFLKRIKRKLKSEKGESIAEVLVALLVSMLGLVLLASMITTSVNIVTKSKENTKKYVVAENYLVNPTGTAPTGVSSGGGKVSSGDMTLAPGVGGSANPISVNYYSNTVFGTRPIIAYKKTNTTP